MKASKSRFLGWSRVWKLLMVLVMVLAFTGCSEMLDPPDTDTVVESEDGKVSLRIPQGAVPEGTNIAIEDVTDTAPGGALGPVYSITPEGLMFNSPVALSLSYDTEDVPPEVDEDRLSIVRLVDVGWLCLTTDHDRSARTLTTSLSRLSQFSIAAVDDGDPIPKADVEAMARDLYNALDDRDSFIALAEEILSYFAPVLDIVEDEDSIDSFLDDGIPFFVDIHGESLYDGFQNGILVCVESFFESMNSAGIEGSSNIPILDPSVMEGAMLHLLFKDEYEPREVLPALIIELARERGTVNRPTESLVWGDGLLDPLQFMLLSYAMHHASVDMDRVDMASTGQPRPLISREKITGFIGDVIGLPLTKKQAAKATITASVILNSYFINLDDMDPSSIWRRWPENPGANPYETETTVNVIFEFHTGPMRRAFLDYLSGGLPSNGPSAGKRAIWKLTDHAPDHGDFSSKEEITNTDGQATVVYTTYDEPVPPDERTELQVDSGGIQVLIRGLLSDRFNALEYIVVFLDRTLARDYAPFIIYFYGRDDDDNDDPSPNQSWRSFLRRPTLNF